MSKQVIKNTQFATETVDGIKDTLIVAATGSIVITDNSSYAIEATGAGASIKVFGEVLAPELDGSGADAAIHLGGKNIDLFVGAQGLISSEVAVFADNSGVSIINEGDIVGEGSGGFGVVMGNGTFVNHGRVYAYQAAVEIVGSATFTNAEDGKLFGSNYALLSNGTAGMESNYINHGKIIGNVLDADATIKLVNDGQILGSVDLGDGNDVIDNRGGRISGPIYGGGGSDTLITDRASDVLVETFSDFDTDIVRSTVSYVLSDNIEKLVLLGAKNINATGNNETNTIYGNGGDNQLKGRGGADHLAGGRGNDALVGGDGNDQFLFSKGDGIDTIRDFADGDDKIYLSRFAPIDSYDELEPLIKKHGGDIWVDFGHGDRLVIADTTRAELDASDFPFPV